jgi:hypothetical protein
VLDLIKMWRECAVEETDDRRFTGCLLHATPLVLSVGVSSLPCGLLSSPIQVRSPRAGLRFDKCT